MKLLEVITPGVVTYVAFPGVRTAAACVGSTEKQCMAVLQVAQRKHPDLVGGWEIIDSEQFQSYPRKQTFVELKPFLNLIDRLFWNGDDQPSLTDQVAAWKQTQQSTKH